MAMIREDWFLANLNNYREILSCLREIKLCYSRKKEGLTNFEKRIVKVISSEGKIEII